jgi:carboxymethylenebutenolidase
MRNERSSRTELVRCRTDSFAVLAQAIERDVRVERIRLRGENARARLAVSRDLPFPGASIMNAFTKLSTALFLGALLGCAAEPTERSETAANDLVATQKDAPPQKEAPKKDAAPQKGGDTGVLSEEEFKALHTLRKDAAPQLHGTMVKIGDDQAYLSLPANAKAPLPAIVVIHEWWGLNDHVKHWADRLAADGYAALAVDLYGGKVATNPDEAMKSMKSVDADKAVKTMLAGYRFLADDSRVQAKKRASIGWCFGGGMSLKLALNAPELDACVMYYGTPVTDPKALASLHAPLLAIFGERDKAFPKELREEFDKALTAAGKEHKVLVYDAEHAFANPSGAHYDEKSAGEAWAEARKFLAAHLKAQK